jgi:formamidopyrimidine-DNA glycosylase
MLVGKIITQANGYGGMVEIKADDIAILINDGVRLRLLDTAESRPKKHQLLIEFEDNTALSASVQMYGGILCFRDGELDNPYYDVAKMKPSPFSDDFSRSYFEKMISSSEMQKISAKAFLATQQRIPGLGNGVLQDILFHAGINPKTKIKSLSEEKKGLLFEQVKTVLAEMMNLGGRDTEKDLFGNPGGYKTLMSKNSINSGCPVCGGQIHKESYLGGSVYYCANCQKPE